MEAGTSGHESGWLRCVCGVRVCHVHNVAWLTWRVRGVKRRSQKQQVPALAKQETQGLFAKTKTPPKIPYFLLL